MNLREIGDESERLASASYETDGYSIVARNFRTRSGEIDIIASNANVIAFVEVKKWSSLPLEDLSRVVGERKRARIVETSKIFLSLNRQYNGTRVRYDVAVVRPHGVERIESAFTE